MAEIQDYHHKTSSRQKGRKNPFPALWQRFRSLDEFTQIAIVALLLIVIVVPLIFGVKNIQTLKNHAASQVGAYDDEFVGPFASWINVKTVYGAKGDGVTDDTQALQQAFNDVGTAGHGTILWIPAGTYKITSTITLAAKDSVGVIGEDPATTKFVWAGPTATPMVYVNGIVFSRIDRLTFEGNGSTISGVIGVDQSWDNHTGYFDTHNEYADDYFQNMDLGIRCGNLGYGCAETSVLRSHFTNITQAGIIMKNFNALDMWVWYSTFDHCNYGVTDSPGAGDFHVYNSNFINSKSSDMSIGNTSLFSARNNTSLNSTAFFVSTGGTNGAATTTLQGNTIIDPTGIPGGYPNSNSVISISGTGSLALIDNTIRSLSTVTAGPIVFKGGFNPGDLFSIGNTFTVPNALSTNGKLQSVDDQVVPITQLSSLTLPTLPGTLPNYNRQVFEVPAGASTATIQNLINQATSVANKAIVHFAYGTYNITQTLQIPANSDVQIVGDGIETTTINWQGTGSGAVVHVAGPSKAQFRDIRIIGGSADGMVIDNADQPGARIYMEGAGFTSGQQANLFADGLDYTTIEMHDSHVAYSNGAGLKVTGGPSANAGNWLGGKVNYFSGTSGASTTTSIPYVVTNAGHLLVQDVWNEQTYPAFANISGMATATFDDDRINSPLNQTPPAISVNNLNGKITMLENQLDDRLIISGDGTNANVLGSGILSYQTNYFLNNASPLAHALSFNDQYVDGAGGHEIADVGTFDPNFVRDMMTQERQEKPGLLTALPAGVTDVRFFKADVDQSVTDLHIVAGTAPTIAPSPTPTQPVLPTSTVTPTVGIVDTQAPSVTSFTLSNSQTKALVTNGVVSRKTSYTLTAVAQDNVGVAKVLFSVNNSTLCTDVSVPYTCTWKVPNGRNNTSYTLKATAYDLAGNISSPSTITVTSQ